MRGDIPTLLYTSSWCTTQLSTGKISTLLHTFVENVWKGIDLDRDRLKLRDFSKHCARTSSFIVAAGADRHVLR